MSKSDFIEIYSSKMGQKGVKKRRTELKRTWGPFLETPKKAFFRVFPVRGFCNFTKGGSSGIFGVFLTIFFHSPLSDRILVLSRLAESKWSFLTFFWAKNAFFSVFFDF